MRQDQHSSNFAPDRWGNEDAEEETKSLCLPQSVLIKSSFSLEKKARLKAEITNALRIARCESIVLSVAFSQAIFVLVSGAHESGI